MSSPVIARRAVITALLAVVACAALAVHASGASAARARGTGGSYNGLALTPPMGYNDWSYYQCNVDEQVILSEGRALVRSGLAAKGYDTVTTDDCWMAKTRTASGELRANPTKFPHGMAYVGRRLHAMGLKFGIYEDAGTQTCGGFAGSWGHYRQTAEQFARWGVDYVKLDGCNVPTVKGQSSAQTYIAAYRRFSRALVATGRRIVFSASAPAYFQGTPQWDEVIAATSRISNLWREGADIPLGQADGAEKWTGIDGNYEYNVGLGRFAGPGHWNDPDMLLVGDSGLSDTEMQSQMTLWSEMAAPLIISTDLPAASPAALQILGNRRIIAVDQDRLGVQGHVIASHAGDQTLTKPLTGGSASVVLFDANAGGQTLSTTVSKAGLPRTSGYELTDLVTGARTETSGTIAAGVDGHGTVIDRVTPHAPAGLPSAAEVSLSQPTTTPGSAQSVTATVTDDGRAPIGGGTVSLSVPSGWTVAPASRSLPRIAPGGHASVSFSVVAGTAAPGLTVSDLVASASYRSAGQHASADGQTSVSTDVPYPTLASAFNDVGITSESDPAAGNFDGGDDSYSAQALASVGVTPGSTVSTNGTTFTWPAVAAGTLDNVQAAGETIDLTGSGAKLAFLGAEAGFSQSPVTVTYTDGSMSTAQLGFPNWCCAATNGDGASPAIVTTHRDEFSGPADYGTDYDVFYNSIAIDPSKTVARVTLPVDSDIHLFAMTVEG